MPTNDWTGNINQAYKRTQQNNKNWMNPQNSGSMGGQNYESGSAEMWDPSNNASARPSTSMGGPGPGGMGTGRKTDGSGLGGGNIKDHMTRTKGQKFGPLEHRPGSRNPYGGRTRKKDIKATTTYSGKHMAKG